MKPDMESLPHTNIGDQNTLLQIDLTDPEYEALARFAHRIAKLLSGPTVQADANLTGSLDDLLGAVYALILAKRGDFADRTDRPIEIAAVRKRAGQIEKGEVRIDGKWMAGFHFNSALFRAAAVYHRILKIAVGRPATEDNVPKLREEATKLYHGWKKATWSNRHIHALHVQVNALKHTPRGVHDKRTVRYKDAVAGVSELLDLIEAWKGG